MKKFKNVLFVLLMVVILSPFKAKAIVDNPLTKLEVETKQGTGNFNVSGGQKNFSFSLASTLSYANIIAESSNPAYTITGAGHVEVKEGMNTINVVVTDPSDNTSKTYTINLNFRKKGNVINGSNNTDNSGETNPSTGAFLNYSLIALGVVSGAVLIIKSKKTKKMF